MSQFAGYWTVVDERWGRAAVDYSALNEMGNYREYVASHHQLVRSGFRSTPRATSVDISLGSHKER